jgi:hypothetical protein
MLCPCDALSIVFVRLRLFTIDFARGDTIELGCRGPETGVVPLCYEYRDFFIGLLIIALI